MITGRVGDESILVNEETLFYGAPKERLNPDTRRSLGRIRSLLRDGKPGEAAFYARAALTGTPRSLSPFQPAGILRFIYDNPPLPPAVPAGYRRELDIDNAVAAVSFSLGDRVYHREYFCSMGDANVLAVRLTGGPVSLIAGLYRRPFEEHSGRIDDHTVGLWGRAGDGGVRYFGAARVLAEGGLFEVLGDAITLRDAERVVIYTCFATDYGENDEYRDYVLKELTNAERIGYDELKKQHTGEYHKLYCRMELSLNEVQPPEEMTDRLLENLRQGGGEDCLDYLCLLEFNMGRYLLISSSWNCQVPANLQGLWNGNFTPPWESVYTININLEMNYWPAEVCNLSECTLPLFSLIDRIVQNGRKTARELYGAGGFVAHHNTDLWGDTAPVGISDPSSFWVMGGAWLSLHLYEHYRYTRDRDFLKTRAFPVMEEALSFFLDYVTEDDQGQLHTGPSVSPENTYITKDGQRAALCMSPAADIQILRELHKAYEEAGAVLGVQSERREKIAAMIRRLPETRLTGDGRIREWLEDYEEVEPGHRHISHLFALHPGSQITEDTPELFAAAKRTLEKRLSQGGGHTGWSCAWAIMFYARLKDGNTAYKYIRHLLEGKTSENMLNVHPPFQIDGNFGFTAAAAEMLVQSHAAYCELLPALPEAWKSGRVRGLRLRGAVTLGMTWEEKKLKEALFTADGDTRLTVRYQDKKTVLDLKKGVSSPLFWP
jgi:alpha-L-fucosidase 2